MSRPGSSRLTSAHLMSALALFVALGGTSYAVTKLPKNSVGSAQVKDGSLTTKDLAAGVATSGPAGPAGARGPRGAEGPTGRSELPTVRIANTYDSVLPLPPLKDGGQGLKLLLIPNIPGGTYRVDFAGAVSVAPAGGNTPENRISAWCDIMMRGIGESESKAVRVSINGTDLDFSTALGDRDALSDVATVTRPDAFDLWAFCHTNLTTPQASMIHSKLAVTPIGGVTVVPQ